MPVKDVEFRCYVILLSKIYYLKLGLGKISLLFSRKAHLIWDARINLQICKSVENFDIRKWLFGILVQFTLERSSKLLDSRNGILLLVSLTTEHRGLPLDG